MVNFSQRIPLTPLSSIRLNGESAPRSLILVATLLVATLVVAALVPALAFSQGALPELVTADDPAKGPDRLRVLHVTGADSGDVPKNLKKYTNYLRRAGSQHWKLQSQKAIQLKGTQPLEVALPEKLGKAIISVDAKRVATVRFMDPQGKSLGKYRSSRFPLVIVNQRMKLKGQPYVFILDLPAKK
ncbi:MAG: hypothetical protein ACPHP7_10370 [Planctomycetota bacterium]